jgi:hypothetical protein
VWDANLEWDLAFPHLAHGTPAHPQGAASPPNPRTAPARANPADQGAPTMTNNIPTDERLPRALSLYWASDRDETGELLQERAILAEQTPP